MSLYTLHVHHMVLEHSVRSLRDLTEITERVWAPLVAKQHDQSTFLVDSPTPFVLLEFVSNSATIF